VGFAEELIDAAAARGLAVSDVRHPEPLAGLEYSDELALKEGALAAFWERHGLPGRPEPPVPAPAPRGYRTTTKRRALPGARGLALGFPGAAPDASGVSPSRLDLPAHAPVYGLLLERLRRPPARALAAELNWAVVRGDAAGLTVILNVTRFDAAVVRAGKHLADALQQAPLGVRAAFLYLDPGGSDYYLEARRPAGRLTVKRLFGPEWLQVEVDGVRLRFPPTVFSQVNQAMLPAMTATVRELAGGLDGRTLLDLYCGYGLFSFTVGGRAARVLGVDLDGPAIQAARATADHRRCADRVRFVAGRIDGGLIADRLPPARGDEVAMLDPPRQGTAADVVAALAAREPVRAVHVCCGTDEIPREVGAWRDAGYRLRRAVPLDLFAGTAALETVLLLGR